MSQSELACTYAALILNDDGVEITGDKILKICKAANVSVESYWPSLFAKYFQKNKVEDLISGVGVPGAGGAAVAAAPAAGGAAAPAAAAEEKKEEKKKEPEKEEEEEDEDMGFSLFD